MTHSLEAVTTATLALALDAAALRQQAITANIANHATPGYVPVKVDFETQLSELRRSLDANGSVNAAALVGLQPQMTPVLNVDGSVPKVQLDAQVADLSQNAVQFQMLAKALNRHFAVMALAAADGRK